MTRGGDDDLGQGPDEVPPVRHRPRKPSVLAEIEAHWRELKARSPHLPRRAGRVNGEARALFSADPPFQARRARLSGRNCPDAVVAELVDAQR